MEINQPSIFIISAPSGAGKTTIIKQAQQSIPNIAFSISHTSRSPRPGEKNGVDYYFVDADAFRKKIERGEFLEWAEVHGNFYGTTKSEISRLNEKGKIVILDIDVQGALQIKGVKDLDSTFIFIEPPSIEELEKRLQNRGTETEQTVKKRVENAVSELSFKDQYDFVIMNDELDRAVAEFVSIITNLNKPN